MNEFLQRAATMATNDLVELMDAVNEESTRIYMIPFLSAYQMNYCAMLHKLYWAMCPKAK